MYECNSLVISFEGVEKGIHIIVQIKDTREIIKNERGVNLMLSIINATNEKIKKNAKNNANKFIKKNEKKIN
jgi:hypothetical protein